MHNICAMKPSDSFAWIARGRMTATEDFSEGRTAFFEKRRLRLEGRKP